MSCPHCQDWPHVHFCLKAPMCKVPDCGCRLPDRRSEWRLWDGRTGETKAR